MAGKPKTIDELADEKYHDKEVRDAVVAHAKECDTVERIECGELALPHPYDAETWYRRTRTEKPKG